ncbi:MAG: winged helix DNA-binding domain-containing protein [Acidimicrobiales bacterium]
MLGVSWPQALAWRAERQLLVSPLPDVVEVARQLAGVQAQVASSAEQAVWLRSGLAPTVTRSALWEERKLVKTWAMRGTLHWLPADEYPMWTVALRDKERNLKRGAAWERYHGMSYAQLLAITDAVAEIVGATPLNRQELASQLSDHTGDPALGQAVRSSFGGSVLKTAAAEGSLCFGPDRGRNVTFVDPKRWIPGRWSEPSAEEARACVVRRFLDACGPATAADLARWWGVPPAEGKRLLRGVGEEAEEVELDGERAWVLTDSIDSLAAASPLKGHVRLLPGFDTYVLSPHSHRRHAWPEGRHDRISRAAGWITPTVLVDGRIAAVWQPERCAGKVSIQIEPLSKLSSRLRSGIVEAALAYQTPLGAEVTVGWVERIGTQKG